MGSSRLNMKIAIVVTMGGNFGARGFYNRQEVGMARGLAKLGHEVEVHKTVPAGQEACIETLGENCRLKDVPRPFLGDNGWFDLDGFEAFRPDALIMFTDIQLAVPSVERWCKRRRIPFVPYVGTMRTNKKGRRALERFSRWRNFNAIRRRSVLVQNLAVVEDLQANGIKDTTLVPFGVDPTGFPALTPDARKDARKTFGLASGPVVGFVGQMMPYKAPLGLIPLLIELRCQTPWQLAVVGDGPLAGEFKQAIADAGLQDAVRWIKRLPNTEMWKLYVACDVLVNLNPGEIVGMCLLEAMHYGRPVVAVDAPGPRLIIEHGVSGYLGAGDAPTLAHFVRKAFDDRDIMGAAGESRVAACFSWTASATLIEHVLQG